MNRELGGTPTAADTRRSSQHICTPAVNSGPLLSCIQMSLGYRIRLRVCGSRATGNGQARQSISVASGSRWVHGSPGIQRCVLTVSRTGTGCGECTGTERIEPVMSVTKTRKTELIQEYRRGDGDTGSPDVQVAVLTERVNALTEHMRTHPKDHACRRGLLMMVSRRRRLLDYIRRHDSDRYLALIGKLGIRK